MTALQTMPQCYRCNGSDRVVPVPGPTLKELKMRVCSCVTVFVYVCLFGYRCVFVSL